VDLFVIDYQYGWLLARHGCNVNKEKEGALPVSSFLEKTGNPAI